MYKKQVITIRFCQTLVEALLFKKSLFERSGTIEQPVTDRVIVVNFSSRQEGYLNVLTCNKAFSICRKQHHILGSFPMVWAL